MAFARGRGYPLSAKKDSVRPLRRPGEVGLKQRFGNDSNGEYSEIKKDNLDLLCGNICKMTLSEPKKEFDAVALDSRFLCSSTEDVQNLVDKIFLFALRNKWNAHAMVLFCEYYIDHSAESKLDNSKLRYPLLRKLQSLYLERNKSYLNLENFLMEVTVACEIFYHIRIDSNPIQVLAHPILDYLGMLVEGGSQKEIGVVQEQFPKCFKDLKANDPDGIETLSIKIRKQLVKTDNVNVRTVLLEMLEIILTDSQPFSKDVKAFYDSLLEPVSRICE